MIFIQFHEQTLHNISTTECEYLVRVDLFLDGVDETACRLVRLVLIRNLLDAVDDGRVISAAEQRTDGISRCVGHILTYIHGNLTRSCNVFAPVLGDHLI